MSALPLIHYLSMLRLSGSTVTASSTASGFSAAHLYDLKAYTLWKSDVLTSPITIDIDCGAGNAEDADALTLVNTNLATLGATVEILADTFTPPTTVRQAAFTPSSDHVVLKTFTAPGAFRYWRLSIAHASPPFAAAPFVGQALLGLKTSIPERLTAQFDPFTDDVAAVSVRSAGGHYLGSLLQGHAHRDSLSFGEGGIARSHFTSDLNALIEYMKLRKPFAFVLDTSDSDFATARWLRIPDDGRITRRAVGGSWGRLQPTIPFEEAYMEPAS